MVFLTFKSRETEVRELWLSSMPPAVLPALSIALQTAGERGTEDTALPWLVHFVEGVVVFLSSSLLEFLL